MAHTEREKLILKMARHGRMFTAAMVEAREETGVEDLSTLAKALADTIEVDYEYITECFKMYRRYCEINGIAPGSKV